MGQAKPGFPEASALTEDESVSIGAYLARQRRLRGIGLDDLARDTRIPRRSLERLEAGAFDAAPDGFARGFVRTVADALGLDPNQAVARMLPEPASQSGREGRRLARAARSPIGWLGIAVLLVSGIGLWVSSSRTPTSPVPGSPATELIQRRDAVRDLAESTGVLSAPPRVPGAGTPP